MARKADTIDGPARGRVAGVLVAVVVLQVLFALSYLAAFHDPAPHRLRVSVAAPSAQLAAQTVTRLTTAAGDALDPQAVATAEQARAQVRGRLAQAGFVIGQSGDTLYVASAVSVSQSGLLTSRFQALEVAQHRTLTVTDVAPLPKADSRGVAPFYVTLVMVFGGYLGVTVLSLVTGPAPHRLRAAGLRLGAHDVARPLVVLLIWAFGGAAGAMTVGARR